MSADRPRPLVAGNWKMHGLKSSVQVLHEVAAGYAPALKDKVDLLICPPATLIHAFALQAQGSGVAIGAQDAHAEPQGAYTGNVSAEMLARPRRDPRHHRAFGAPRLPSRVGR